MADVGTIYTDGLDFFGRIVEGVPGTAWDRPSPCAGWSVRDVLGHVGQATRFGTALLTGEAPGWSPSEPPGDAVEGDPAAWWRGLSDSIRAAVARADLGRMVDSPAGERSVADGLTFPAIDLYVHGWDLARAAGLRVEIPADAIEFTEGVISGLPSEQIRSERVFAAARDAGTDPSPTDALIAWTGRDPGWSPVAG